MTFMDDNDTEYPLTDASFGPPRFDRRRLMAAVAVSVLGVLVVVLMVGAVASGSKHSGPRPRSVARRAAGAARAPVRDVRRRLPVNTSWPDSGGGVCDDPDLRRFVPDGFCPDAAPTDNPAPADDPAPAGDPAPSSSDEGTGQASSAVATPDGWQRYDVNSAGRSATMDAPSDWTEKYDDAGTFMLVSRDGLSGAGAGAANYNGQPLDGLADQYVEEVRGSYAPDLEVTDRGPATFIGRDGYRLAFTATQDRKRWNAEVRFIVDGDTLWIGMWTHNADAMDGEDVAARVLDSLQLPTPA